MPRKRKKKIHFHLEEKQSREESQNEAVRKRINVTSQRNMMKRYKMYGATVSKLTEKSQNDTKKGERK